MRRPRFQCLCTAFSRLVEILKPSFATRSQPRTLLAFCRCYRWTVHSQSGRGARCPLRTKGFVPYNHRPAYASDGGYPHARTGQANSGELFQWTVSPDCSGNKCVQGSNCRSCCTLRCPREGFCILSCPDHVHHLVHEGHQNVSKLTDSSTVWPYCIMSVGDNLNRGEGRSCEPAHGRG